MPVILAHGALGPYDELIFAVVGVAFLVMMGISWVRSRNEPLDDDDTAPLETTTTTDADRFRLQ
jgi:hypothetical protein